MAAPVTAAVGRKGRGEEGRGGRKKGSNYAARPVAFDFAVGYQLCKSPE